MQTGLWLAYLGLALGLMSYGAILIVLGVRRPVHPAGRLLRVIMGLAVLLAVAGTTAAAILEAKASQPW
jgi:hypothetical protein